jgi:hypothetical protein
MKSVVKLIMLLCVVIALLIPNQSQAANEIKRDGRFIAYDDGTVLDTKTNLMWAAKDNGKRINWPDAKKYCESYRGGGYKDWRMPTQDELLGLFDRSKPRLVPCDDSYSKEVIYVVTDLIRITCYAPWAEGIEGTGRNAPANIVEFGAGVKGFFPQALESLGRALPVRSVK